MLLMGLGLRVVPWADLHAFATLLGTFWRGAERRGRSAAEGPKAKTRTGLASVVSHPCLKNKGTARMGHPAQVDAQTFDGLKPFFGGLVEFSDIFLHGVCPPED